jgi:hypothetical protein
MRRNSCGDEGDEGGPGARAAKDGEEEHVAARPALETPAREGVEEAGEETTDDVFFITLQISLFSFYPDTRHVP